MNIPTQEEYSKLSTEQKFRLAVNAFKATCDILFETDCEFEIEIQTVPFKYLAELSKDNGNDIVKHETNSIGTWHTLQLNPDDKRHELKISTFKL